jgi:2-dehydropantoate 2-reductase
MERFMTSYAILGTGAVGGYYGGLLQRAGREVHFLLRSDYDHVRRNGLRVDSVKGDFILERVNAYDRADAMPRCDVAVLAWKTTENARLADVLPKVLKPGGVALVLQNGLDPEREAAACVGDAKILGGLCFLCSRKQGPGWIRHLDYGAITLAAYSPDGSGRPMGVTPEMRRVGEEWQGAGIEMRMQEDWRSARWRKLVWNIPFNGLCALLNADTSELMRHRPTRDLIRDLMEEVAAGAKACGAPLPDGFVEKMLTDTDAMAPYEPSMKLDRDAGRAMELGAIYGRTLSEIARARADASAHQGSNPHGGAVLIESMYRQLTFIDSKR